MSPTDDALRRLSAAALAGCLGAFAAGAPGAVVALIVVVALPVVQRRRARRARCRAIDTDVATIFELAARAVRAGARVSEALDEAAKVTGGPSGALIAAVMAAATATGGGGAAVAPHAEDLAVAHGMRRETARVVAAVAGMVLGAAGGGARGLEAGASLLRERERFRAEIVAAASHARASALLLVAVPVLFGGLGFAVVPGWAAGIGARPAVQAAVAVGVGCAAAGAVWTTRLVRSAEELGT